MNDQQEKQTCSLRFGLSIDTPDELSHDEQHRLYGFLTELAKTLNPMGKDYNECGLSLDSEVAMQAVTHHNNIRKAVYDIKVLEARLKNQTDHPVTKEIYTYIDQIKDGDDSYLQYDFEEEVFYTSNGKHIDPASIEILSGWVTE